MTASAICKQKMRKVYEKIDSIVHHTIYETNKTPYQTQVDENKQKGREFFWVSCKKLFGTMNSMVIENLGIVNISCGGWF